MSNEIVEVPKNVKLIFSINQIRTDDNMFVHSCKVALLRQRYKENIVQANKIIQAVYYDDDEYIQHCIDNVEKKKMNTFGRIVLLIIIADIIVGVLNPVFSLIAKISAGIALTIIWGARIALWVLLWRLLPIANEKIEEAKIRKEAKANLPRYRAEREKHKELYADAESSLETAVSFCKVLDPYLSQITDENRDAIPEAYWDYGGEFLYLYNTRRADNVKDAVNIWEQILHQERMESEQRRQGMVIDQTNQLAAEARAYAQSAAISASVAAANSAAAASYSAGAYYNTY